MRSKRVHDSLLSGIQTRFQYLKEDPLFAYATFFDPTTKSILPDVYLNDHEHNIIHQVYIYSSLSDYNNLPRLILAFPLQFKLMIQSKFIGFQKKL